ncbi:MAG: hypothetical protein KBG15_06815 [Kofleriaceae bacterium]|nr:hypothetical protein [Kofleriaceae bacterium]
MLFIHGLESGPTGQKVRTLHSAGFEVVSLQMPCGRRGIQRDPVLWIGAGLGIAAVVAAALVGPWWSAVIAAVAALLMLPLARAALIRRMLQRSVAVQQQALATHQIDVVVGSSFGGAVGLALLQHNLWSGPTVLLCPAHRLVAQRALAAQPAELAALPPELAAHVVVVHGRQDDIVPVAHSQALVASSAGTLVLVDDDHRLTATATEANFKAWITQAVGAKL